MNVHASQSSWTTERIATLAELWAKGGSASEIAKALGGFEHAKDGGRNAVIGKAHRLALQRETDNVKWTDQETETLIHLWTGGCNSLYIARRLGDIFTAGAVNTKAHKLGLKRKRAKRATRRYHSTPVAPTPVEMTPDVIDLAIPVEQRKSLFELTNRTCRWPVGDPQTPEFFFCGAPPTSESSYCCAHHRVAHA